VRGEGGVGVGMLMPGALSWQCLQTVGAMAENHTGGRSWPCSALAFWDWAAVVGMERKNRQQRRHQIGGRHCHPNGVCAG